MVRSELCKYWTTPAVARFSPGTIRIASYNGLKHAEQKIVQCTTDKGYQLISIGAGKPMCQACVSAIEALSARQPFPVHFVP